ncbi:hypothetical protein KK120_08745 [Virgibacillus dakarensis]|nr:hypothetical protein [Virgibacillus dakarensis]MBT2215909.1 hypothetical protein [Virgibacillus dakarensis]
MGADMNVTVRNRISELGLKGKRLEGQVLKQAGEVLAKGIANNINRSKSSGAGYKHLEDYIVVSNVKTNEFGERSVQVSAIKELGYRLKFLEFGTSKMSAQAPVTKGAAQTKDDVAGILADGTRRIMRL